MVEEAVAKAERKSPESDRQAIETFVVPMGPSYCFPFVIQVPCMQPSLATMLDGLLHLREGYAGYSMVDIIVVVRQIEYRNDGRSQVIILGQTLLVFTPYFKESIGLEVRGSLRSSSSLLIGHGFS